MTRRIGRWVGGAILIGVTAGLLVLRPDRIARIATAATAHFLCSAVFVQGISPDMTYREFMQPQLGPLGSAMHFQIDSTNRMAKASLAGLVRARAKFTPGYGCRSEYPSNRPAPSPSSLPAPRADDLGFAPPTPVSATDPAISAAIDRVFAEDPKKPIKEVKAVVVVKDGHVIAERYAQGFGVDTPLLSNSVAKSVTNALLGVLVRQGRLRVDQPVAAPEWAGTGDPRGRITIEELLRMRSGLDVDESESVFSPVARMEYTVADMAGFAARHELRDVPDTKFEYTSANTVILDRLLGSTIGGGAAGMRGFAERELFGPAGMTHVTMEFDGAGTFVGSTYVYAPARSYARFGQLYLNDGLTPDGHRILPEGWVAWSRRSLKGEPYGAGFWTNDGNGEDQAWRIAHGFPKDGFFASGALGQRIYVVPSAHLVIARFGYSRLPFWGFPDDIEMVDAVIRAVGSKRPSDVH